MKTRMNALRFGRLCLTNMWRRRIMSGKANEARVGSLRPPHNRTSKRSPSRVTGTAKPAAKSTRLARILSNPHNRDGHQEAQ